MGGRGAYYVPGRSRSVTSGAHKPWGIMGWPIVKAVALERFWEGGASCQNRSETVGPPRAYRAFRLRGPTDGAYRLQGLHSPYVAKQWSQESDLKSRPRPSLLRST